MSPAVPTTGRSRRRARLLPGDIRARLFLLIALTLLPLLILIGWVHYQRYQLRRATALETELEVAQGVATIFKAYVDGVQRQNYVVGQGILTFSPYTETKVLNLLAAAVEQYPSIRNLSWVNADGSVLVSTLPSFVGRSIADRAYFRRILAGSPWAIGDLTPRGIVTPAPTFAIATAVRDGTGLLRGVVVAGIEPSNLDEVALLHGRSGGASYAVFDSQGALVYRSPELGYTWEDRTRWRDTDPALRRVIETGRAQIAIQELAIPGGTWVSARTPISGTGWIAGAGQPVESAFAPVRRGLALDALLALVIASLAFLTAYVLARTISDPILRLERDAQEMGGGRVEARSDPLAPIEVRHLRETVQTMASDLIRRADALRASEERYRQISEELDQRVRDRTAQLEAVNRELESFAYSVSHDLRAPLRAIDGFSLALLEDYEDKLDQEGKEYLHFVRDAAQRMARLIDDILRLSRVGRAEMIFENVDLSAMAASVVGELRQQSPERQVDISIQPSLTVCGDSDLLRIVLENLLGNAWKYTSKSAQARIEFAATERDGERVYYVRDNGAGFDMAYVDKLFTPFQRLHTEAEFPGTGIGLSIVRRIVTRHGGRVWAEGEVDKGATFYFTIPTGAKCT